MKAFFEARRPHEGATYEEYLAAWQAEIQSPTEGLDKRARKMAYYKQYNWERSESVQAAYTPSEALAAALQEVEAPQLWMVLTEPWCGDSAYNLPVIAEAAAASEQVTLRLLARDDNLDIMDQYLTNGGRSIPKLVAFAEDGTELFQWGPRPEEAQALRNELLDAGLDGMEVVNRLLTWYEEGGWRQVDDELAAALQSVSAVAP